MFVFLIIIVRTSSLKKREKIPYTLSGQISGGRHTLQGRSMTITDLNIYIDTSIGSLFGRLVPLGSVGSPTVAMMHDDVENMHVYIGVYIGIGGENWLSQQRPTYRVERDTLVLDPIRPSSYTTRLGKVAIGQTCHGYLNSDLSETFCMLIKDIKDASSLL